MSNRFNTYMTSHFSGCRLLANAVDPYRNSQVKLYALPGEFDLVGVTDGTDAWMAPVSGDPFSVSVKRIMSDIREGKEVASPGRQRQRVVIAQPRTRVTTEQQPQRKERVRVQVS